MNLPYEILIRGNADGTLSGCHAVDTVGGNARPITPDDLELIAPTINAAALTTNADQLAIVQAELTAKNALIDSIKNAIADADLDDAATVSSIKQVLADAELPSVEKRKLEISAEIAAKQAELEAL
jgi:hypothetical protein